MEVRNTYNIDKQRIAKNTGYLFVRMIIVLCVTLYTSRVVLKALGFEDFGIYNVVGSVVVFLGFFRAALTNATYRYIAFELGTGNAEQLKKVYSMAINCHLILALVLFIIMELLGVWFINNYLSIPSERLIAANWVYHFSLITFSFSIIRTPFNSNIIAHEHMNFYALISIVEAMMSLIVAYTISHSPNDKLITYAALHTSVAIVIFLCYFAYSYLTFHDTVYVKCWESKLLKKFSSYAGWSLLVNSADLTTGQCISIFFNIFLGVIANAALGISNQVIAAFNHFLSTFSNAYNPQIIKNYAAGRYDLFMKLVLSMSKVSFFLIYTLCVPIVLNTDYVLRLWLGDYPPMASAFIKTIIVYVLIDAFQSPLWQAVYATGNIRTHQLYMSVIKFITIPAIYIVLLLGGSGILALSIRVISNAACALVRTIYMKQLIKLNLSLYFKTVFIRIMIVIVLSYPSVYFSTYFISDSLQKFILSTISSIVLILFLSYYLGLSKEERNVVKSLPLVIKITKRIC